MDTYHESVQMLCSDILSADLSVSSISGLVVEYIVAIDVTRVRFPDDAFLLQRFQRLLVIVLVSDAIV